MSAQPAPRPDEAIFRIARALARTAAREDHARQIAAQAAEALRLTAEDLRRLALIDAIIPEPLGGAHRDAGAMLAGVSRQVWDSLEPLLALDGATLRARRREKFLEMGRSGVV